MNARILPVEEWSRLDGTDLSALLPYVEPQNVAVVVVEDDAGAIVASVSAIRVTHLEGLWISPEARGNAGVFRALIRLAFAIPEARGESWAFGGAADADDRMDSLCRRLGGRPLPVKFYAMPTGGS
jgi:hypothetical protein